MGQELKDTIMFGLGIIFLAGLGLFLTPQYCVWQQGLSGKASLEKASQTRQIMVEQARAEVDSAKLRAEAIKIVGQAAKDYPEYRLQEFLGAFGEALNSERIEQIIYVPTEAGIPVMEAGRLSK